MYIAKININNKTVYLKENFGDFYTYSPNVIDAKLWSIKEIAENEINKINKSIFENFSIIDVDELYVDRYFINKFTLKIECVKMLKESVLGDGFGSAEDARIQIDVIRDKSDQYENISVSSWSESNDSNSGYIKPEEEE